MKDNSVCIWDDFNNLYPVSKTLRFELKPVGRTLEKIKEKGLVEEDKKRSEDFLKVKKILDDYFRDFIEKSLNNVELDIKNLEDFKNKFLDLKKDKFNKKLEEEFSKSANKLCKELYRKAGLGIKLGKNLVEKNLVNWLDENNRKEDKEIVLRFKGFSTYFTGFFKNRENIFTDKEISTSVVFRSIYDNLVKFLKNSLNFEKLKKLGVDFTELESGLGEELGKRKISDFFDFENFNKCLSQSGIDNFNCIIGGKTLENGIKIKGVNEIINLTSQKNQDKSLRKLKMEPLFKQILSDRKTVSFVEEKINDDKEMIELIKDKYGGLVSEGVFNHIKELILNLKSYDLKLIYIKNDKNLTNISQEIFSDYNKIKFMLFDWIKVNDAKIKTDNDAEKWFKKQKYFSIAQIEAAIRLIDFKKTLNSEALEKIKGKIGGNFENPICGYFSEFGDENLLVTLERNYLMIKEVLNQIYEEGSKNFIKDEKEIEEKIKGIKTFLDSILNILHFIKKLNYKMGKSSEYSTLDSDNDFYEKFYKLYEKLGVVVPVYNKIRNYVSQKPFSTGKFKLNFENSTLLDGWDKNKETDNCSILFRKEGIYYLGIMSKGNNKIFKNIEKTEDNDFFEKINYKLLSGPNKMLPKVFFAKSNIDYFAPSDEILRIRNTSSFTKSGKSQEGYDKVEFNLQDCHKMIDFYKECLPKYKEWKDYKFKFKETIAYNDISEFYKDISDQGYKINFARIPSSKINTLVEEGKLFLFKIWNKDFSSHSKGKKNLHTIYWNELFSEENLKNVVYKLNGEAEIFYREKSLDKKITHPKNEPISNKDPIGKKKKSLFKYDLIKNKRYTEDKFLFYCPITLNFKGRLNDKILNKKVLNKLKDCGKDVKILGIDRGERHLAYYSLINQQGEIEKQGTFNFVFDKFGRKIDYHKKLDKIEGDRNEARKNWKKIENIKEMKSGYLSQIVHEISKIAIENNAIIIFEDLNYGFKRGRFKIEKQIYQKFEKMLIEKLNYLMFKEADSNEIGGCRKAYQLTPILESFGKLGRQSGIIFYVNASYTSKICPKTGFVNSLRPKYENEHSAKEFFRKFDSIKYNKEEDFFEFKFKYSKFIKDFKSIKDEWTICSFGDRIETKRDSVKNNNFVSNEINISDKFKNLFSEFNIDFRGGGELKDEIQKISSVEFFKSLIYYLKLVLQLRNSETGTDKDYILSCVKDAKGEFFDSRKATDSEPKNADANGAFNIARKGLMVIDRISEFEGEKLDSKIIKIENSDFIDYVIEQDN